MSAQHRTAENFTAAIKSAVEQRGTDWTYPDDVEWMRDNGQCRYRLRSGEPACLIGQALDNLGLLEQVGIEEYDSAETLLQRLGFPYKVGAAAAEAQEVQDASKPWGSALSVYLDVLAGAEVAA